MPLEVGRSHPTHLWAEMTCWKVRELPRIAQDMAVEPEIKCSDSLNTPINTAQTMVNEEMTTAKEWLSAFVALENIKKKKVLSHRHKFAECISSSVHQN